MPARSDIYEAAELFVLAAAEHSRPTWLPERVAALAEALTEATFDVLIDSRATFSTRAEPFDDAAHQYPRGFHETTILPPRRLDHGAAK